MNDYHRIKILLSLASLLCHPLGTENHYNHIFSEQLSGKAVPGIWNARARIFRYIHLTSLDHPGPVDNDFDPSYFSKYGQNVSVICQESQ